MRSRSSKPPRKIRRRAALFLKEVGKAAQLVRARKFSTLDVFKAPEMGSVDIIKPHGKRAYVRVTCQNGFVAGHLKDLLLEKGYRLDDPPILHQTKPVDCYIIDVFV